MGARLDNWRKLNKPILQELHMVKFIKWSNLSDSQIHQMVKNIKWTNLSDGQMYQIVKSIKCQVYQEFFAGGETRPLGRAGVVSGNQTGENIFFFFIIIVIFC